MSPSRSLWIIIPLALLALAALACQFAIDRGLAPEQPKAGTILFQDDFSNPSSGWKRATTTKGQTDYADGVYRIFVNELNLDIWSMPGRDFGDVRIEVEALKVGGERDNRFGIICRAISVDRFYTFIISSDGYYGIGKISGQEYRLIGMDALQPSQAIRLGTALNSLRADCTGDRLALYVNGEKLAEVQDSEFQSGDVGLIAGSYQSAGTDIRFDNFMVYQP